MFLFSTSIDGRRSPSHAASQPRPRLTPNNNSFRGRPKSDDDFLVDAGVGPGAKIAAAETAEWRRSRGADAALARAEAAEQERAAAAARSQVSSHPISTSSPPAENNNNATSSSDPVGRHLDALESQVVALEQEAAAAGLFSPSSFDDQPPRTTTTRSLFSRRQQQEERPASSKALYKEALRLSELSTQQLLKLDAVELPHIGEEEGGAEGGDGNANGNGASASTAAALAGERASALRLRRKALIKRAQALGDAMDRAKERLK